LSQKEITVSGELGLKIADALNTTTLRMLQILGQERLDVSTIGRRLNLSEAYISEQVRLLEELNLIKVNYERGKRGIRKVCESTIEKVTIIIKEQPPTKKTPTPTDPSASFTEPKQA
jgi:predicted transcriptional regulator